MYLHIDTKTAISAQNLIGIFDMERTTTTQPTRIYLEHAERHGEVVESKLPGLPRSFVVHARAGKQKVILTVVSPTTIFERTIS